MRVTARRASISSAAAGARSAHSCAATPSICRRRCGRWHSGTRSRRKPGTATSSCSRTPASKRPRPRRCRRASHEPRGSPPLRRHHRPGDHREGDARLRAQSGDLQGGEERDQAADQGGGREAVRRQGDERQYPGAQGQVQELARPRGVSIRRQESDRDSRRGSQDRRDDGALSGGRGDMALKTYKPVTPGRRQLVLVDRSGLYRGKPVKVLTEGKSSSGGRNNNGRTTVRFRGGGHKQAYRRIDFKRRKFDVTGRVERIEYDPNRTGFIALVRYEDGEAAYILAPQRLAQMRRSSVATRITRSCGSIPASNGWCMAAAWPASARSPTPTT